MKSMIVVTTFLTCLIMACGASFESAPYKAPKCGYHGHECTGGGCCGDEEDCGGGPFNGCPEGMCCSTLDGVGFTRSIHRQTATHR